MDGMQLHDSSVVDLSLSSARSNTVAVNNQNPNVLEPLPNNQQIMVNARRALRPRSDSRNYVESPELETEFLSNGRHTNGNYNYTSDSSDDEMPPMPPIKELTPSEVKQRNLTLKRLREELRTEEMKLVLLKKLKQSQQLKENVAVLPPSIPPSALPPTGLPSGLSITPTTVKVPTTKSQNPQVLHSRTSGMQKPPQSNIPSTLKGQPPVNRSNIHVPSLSSSLNIRGANLSVPQPPRGSMMRSGFPGVKDLSPSVTITPTPLPSKTSGQHDGKGLGGSSSSQTSLSEQDRSREDNQTPAQRQAAAKLALRKQLEKTLLQIPPPKPPPPEMHFIPNPSNTEFIYLVGLEHVVDALTKEVPPVVPSTEPYSCSQCSTDFTPVWKWEKSKSKGKLIICEQCVTTNIKKGLKAEHTNRLKSAFVKALQQEQEIEQRMAQNNLFSSNSPASSPVSSEPIPITTKASTPSPAPRHIATPPAPPVPQPTPPSPRTSHIPQQNDKFSQNAAVQAIQQQILRTLSSAGPPSAAHMMQFSPLFYPYQLAMAQVAAGSGGTNNLAELQRAADMHRQYLLDMIPGPNVPRHNWKA